MKRVFKSIIVFIIIVLLSLCGVNIISGNGGEERNSKINNILILVNRKNGLDKSYIPMDLTIPEIPFSDEATNEEKQVAGIIKEPLEELINEAKKEGIILIGNSAYRSYESQEIIYNNRVRDEGKKSADAYVAKPGFSEHQTGLCIDITNKYRYFAEGTEEAEWLEKNCSRFGFIIRYPKNKKRITGIE